MSFLYIFCSVVMDSPGGEFNNYKSKRFRPDVEYFKLGRIVKLYTTFFQTIANTKVDKLIE